MGKYLRKCKDVGEVAVMEVSPVGVRTRARALAHAAAARRSSSTSSDLRSRRTPGNSVGAENSGRMSADRCSSLDQTAPAHCSSNKSCELLTDRMRSADSEVFGRESTPSSHLRSEYEDLDPASTALVDSSCRRSAAGKIPSSDEIESFFAVLENNELRRFAETYNFDVATEVPLEGRYEWVKLN